ncbi:MAG: type II toxin-antitoxin system RelE/ParE family toxin [Armatimonadetes bacterium]|nr:type II toxin-antitoxin system RelE/ParE family toxin [Armatimonadota bacterium]
MGKYRVVYLPIAEKDLMEIIEYVRMDKPGAALDLLEHIDKAISRLEDFPESGKTPRDIRLQRLNYRLLIVENYLVFYVVKGKEVEIRRILHGQRRYDFLL